ncbi:MAG: hypothetical protein M3033_09005 [Acidobacteriota bacterium]|nr:hypothetical protein [Acidobacteriota bacterium]
MLLAKHFIKTKKIVISLSLFFGFLLLLSLNVCAQNSNNQNPVPNNSNQSIRADDSDLYRIAKVQGYNDGLRRGAKDARKRHKNPQKTIEYKNGTNGFKIYYGKRKDYKQIYAGNNKLYKRAYDEKKKAYQKAYRDAFLEGFSKADNGSLADGRSNVSVRSKRGIFHRIRRFILRH